MRGRWSVWRLRPKSRRPPSRAAQSDSSIVEILGPALRRALTACDVEELILLQLVHIHGVTQREVASLWKWHESRVSRHIKRTEEKIAKLTLQEVKGDGSLLGTSLERLYRTLSKRRGVFEVGPSVTDPF